MGMLDLKRKLEALEAINLKTFYAKYSFSDVFTQDKILCMYNNVWAYIHMQLSTLSHSTEFIRFYLHVQPCAFIFWKVNLISNK